jgi:mercuric ion transport protein
MLLASVGIGSAWLAGIAMTALPYRVPLIAIGALSLFLGGALLIRQQVVAARCAQRGTCTSVFMRFNTLVGLIAGIILLWLGYIYV